MIEMIAPPMKLIINKMMWLPAPKLLINKMTRDVLPCGALKKLIINKMPCDGLRRKKLLINKEVGSNLCARKLIINKRMRPPATKLLINKMPRGGLRHKKLLINNSINGAVARKLIINKAMGSNLRARKLLINKIQCDGLRRKKLLINKEAGSNLCARKLIINKMMRPPATKLLINNKPLAFCVALCLALFFASCTSGRFFVPGGQTMELAAIYAEYASLGDAYMELEKYADAARCYRLAMRDRDIYWASLYKFGRASALAKNWADARDAYEQLLKRDSANSGLRLSLAYIAAMSGDLNAAKNEYENLINELPEDETPLANYIAVLLSQEDFDVAETQISLMRERFPDSESLADFEERLAAAREQNGDGGDAAGDEGAEDSDGQNADGATEENGGAESAVASENADGGSGARNSASENAEAASDDSAEQ